MKKIGLIISVCFLLSRFTNAQEQMHLMLNHGKSMETVSIKSMTKRLADAAEQVESYAPVPRMALFDWAFGVDSVEYKKLNGFGILYLSSLNREIAEYPVKRVYIKQKDGTITDLIQIGSLRINIEEEKIRDVFGSNRIDYYYYFPYYLTQVSGELMVDWTANRTEFLIQELPAPFRLDFIKESNIIHSNEIKEIDVPSLKSFSEREFQIKLD
jgi:hypothetical protein